MTSDREETPPRRVEQLTARLTAVQKELSALGFECSLLWRAPGSARAPVAHLLVGESYADVQQAILAGKR